MLSIIVGLHFHDLYSQIHVKSRIVLLQQLCLVMGVAFLTQGLVGYADPNLRVPMRVMVLGSALAVVAIFFWRILFSAFALRWSAAIACCWWAAARCWKISASLSTDHPESGLEVAGYVDDRHQTGTPLPGGKIARRRWSRCGRSFGPPSPTASWWACSSGATACR